MQIISFLAFYIFIYPVSWLPFFVLYRISDLLYFLLYYLFKYRKNIVYDNLVKAFPEKKSLFIEQVAKQSYKNLADTIVESIKLFSISEQSFLERMKLSDNELTKQYFNKQQPVIAISGHFGNWEYGAVMNHYIQHQLIILYKPLRNKHLNKAIVQSRSKFGLKIRSNKNTKNVFEEKFERPSMVVFIGDQTPSNTKNAYWTNFLGRETCFFKGAAKYSLTYNLPILSFYIKRTKRGFYSMDTFELIPEPMKYSQDEICEIIAREYERQILIEPANWLWTHRRWKHQRDKINA